MKAVLVQKIAVLRDSHVDPTAPVESWHLVPATLEAIRSLGSEDTLVFLYDLPLPGAPPAAEDHQNRGLEVLVKQVGDSGGRVDGLVFYPRPVSFEDTQQAAVPLWSVATRFNLSLNECYVLGDSAGDIQVAHQVGARPLLILGGRTLGAVLGNQPEYKDFPVAPDLTAAVSYIAVEEEISRQLGHPRNDQVPAPPLDTLEADPHNLPSITLTSSLAASTQAKLSRSRAQLADIRRWMTFFIVGAVGLSLGIAYMLTHLYRVTPFPEFAYYITLQFIPRPLRGALFILWGVLVIFIAVRSFYRTTGLRLRRRNRR